jgi:hypothetical protein
MSSSEESASDSIVRMGMEAAVRRYVGQFFEGQSFYPGPRLIADRFGLTIEEARAIIQSMYGPGAKR